jgi:peptide methionine sulfoxide reductase MsrA
MTISGDMYDERITDTNNYNKVFGSSDNAENSPMTGYARGSGSSPTYATVSTPSTTWTEQ